MLAVAFSIATLFSTPISAQQQAVNGLPQTRSPQGSQADLFQQQNDVQNSTNESILSAPREIQLPKGVPTITNVESITEPKNGSLWLEIVISVVALGLAGVYYMHRRLLAKRLQSVPANELQVSREPEVPKEIVAKANRPSEKKKKRRSQTKKKKR